MPVYMLREQFDGPVKIGVSRALYPRLSSLRNANWRELHLIRVLVGGRDLETRLHRLFAHLHIAREWFRFDPAMLGDLGAPDLSPDKPPLPEYEGSKDRYRHGRSSILRAWMEETETSVSALAIQLGVPSSTVCGWLTHGNRPQNGGIRVALNKLTGNRLDHLMGEVSETTSEARSTACRNAAILRRQRSAPPADKQAAA